MSNIAEEIVARPKTRVVGLVVDKVDKIMHGMELGAAGMHNQVGQWAAGPFLIQLFDLLMENGFRVYMSSDHGNIEASGCGRPTEGAVADLRGERARIYPDPVLRRQVGFSQRIRLEWFEQTANLILAGNDAHTGRLLRLQGTAAAAHVQRRVKEDYGERETASRAARRVLRSFIDWGVLKETGDKGVYAQGNGYQIENPRLIAWMVEANLCARMNGSASMKDLLDSPSLFPFRLAHISAEHVGSLSTRLDILRHGLDEDLVMLRETSYS